jgi:hypothetical protein
MKIRKFLIIALTALLLTGCSSSPTSKAKTYMKENYPDLSVTYLNTNEENLKTVISASAEDTNFTIWVSGDEVTDNFIFIKKMKEMSKSISDRLSFDEDVKITAYSESSFQKTHGLSGLTKNTDIPLSDYLKLIDGNTGDDKLVVIIGFKAFNEQSYEKEKAEIEDIMLKSSFWKEYPDSKMAVTVLVNSVLLCSVQVEHGEIVEGTLVNYLADKSDKDSSGADSSKTDGSSKTDSSSQGG